jgi:hypothetical protein
VPVATPPRSAGQQDHHGRHGLQRRYRTVDRDVAPRWRKEVHHAQAATRSHTRRPQPRHCQIDLGLAREGGVCQRPFRTLLRPRRRKGRSAHRTGRARARPLRTVPRPHRVSQPRHELPRGLRRVGRHHRVQPLVNRPGLTSWVAGTSTAYEKISDHHARQGTAPRGPSPAAHRQTAVGRFDQLQSASKSRRTPVDPLLRPAHKGLAVEESPASSRSVAGSASATVAATRSRFGTGGEIPLDRAQPGGEQVARPGPCAPRDVEEFDSSSAGENSSEDRK